MAETGSETPESADAEKAKLQDKELAAFDLAQIYRNEATSPGREIPVAGPGKYVEGVTERDVVDYQKVKKAALETVNPELHIENRRLEQENKTDRLTGLPNDRALLGAIGRLNKELRQQELSREELESTYKNINLPGHLFIKFDLDGLKAINDLIGESAGDELIKRSAEVLRFVGALEEFKLTARSMFRGADAGDEFFVITPEQLAKDFIARVESTFQALVEPYEVEGHRIVTKLPGSSGETISEADEILRKRKHPELATSDPRIANVLMPSEEDSEPNA